MADEAASASPADALSQDQSVSTDAVVENLAPVSDGNPGSSPEPKDENKPESMLDALNAALKAEKPAAESSVAEANQEKASEPAAEKPAGEEDFTDADMPAKGTKAFRRIKQLNARTQQLEAEVSQYKTDAETHRRVIGFIENAGLNTEEVNQGFEIMRLMKADPWNALQALMPYVQQLQQATGRVLPADLEQQVRQGYLTEQHAREKAELQARADFREQQALAAAQAVERNRQQYEQQQRAAQMQSAVSSIEAQWSASDPDYAAKKARVHEKLKLSLYEAQMQGRAPQTAQDAVALAAAAKKAVDDELRAFAPRRQPNVVPLSNAATVAARPQPASMIDAMRQALGQ